MGLSKLIQNLPNKSLIDNRRILRIPENFSVNNGYEAKKSIDFLDQISELSFGDQKLLIDLSSLQYLNAPSALLLFAHISSVQLRTNIHDIIKIQLPIDKSVKALIRNSGLWDAIKYGTERKLEKNWKSENNFQSGFDPDKHLDLTLNALKEKYGQIPNKLGIAINEAMLNITQHAYKYHVQGTVPRWWQYIYIKDKKLNFFIFDKGCGIPTSFKKVSLYNSTQDCDIIVKAMEKKISSTKISGRGNGSFNMKKPVSSTDRDKLLILSNQGLYRYFNSDDYETSKLPIQLQGTLVGWQIRVD